jgi:hypothetical protein
MTSDRTGPSLVDEHEAFMDLVAAYAVDAVDRVEEPAVEHHLDVCADCRGDLRRHHEILALVGSATPTMPPASVWRGIDEQTTGVHGAPDGPPRARDDRRTGEPSTLQLVTNDREPSRAPHGGGHSPHPGRRALLLVAAALVVLAGFFGGVAMQQRQHAEQLGQDLAGSPVERAASQAQADGLHRDLLITSADGTVHARILVDERGAGYFIPNGMAELPAGRAYQLWGISDDGSEARPVSLGVLGPRPGISAFQASVSETTYAVTDEPAGGSQAPTTPVLASATLT